MTTLLLASLIFYPTPAFNGQDEFRQVEIVVPSVTCFSRFRDSLKKEIQKPNDWIKTISVKGLGKRVLAKRPKFDLGNDVVVVAEIRSDKSIRELANLIHQSGYYVSTELWVVRSGHKMKDYRNIPFSELLRPSQKPK